MMRGVIDEGTGRRIRHQFGIAADVAGKTGTTQHGADGWFLLMHPDLVAGAWVGFEEPSVSFRSDWWGQGSHNALLVVGDFFRQAEPQLSDDTFPTPFRYREPGSIYARAGLPDDSLAWDDSLGWGASPDSFYTGEFEPYDDLDGYDPDGVDVEGDSLNPGEPAGAEVTADAGEPTAEEAAAESSGEPQTAVQELYERTGEAAPPEVGQAEADPVVYLFRREASI
jgi:membrane peptidoglycan carboxypeptidase